MPLMVTPPRLQLSITISSPAMVIVCEMCGHRYIGPFCPVCGWPSDNDDCED